MPLQCRQTVRPPRDEKSHQSNGEKVAEADTGLVLNGIEYGRPAARVGVGIHGRRYESVEVAASEAEHETVWG